MADFLIEGGVPLKGRVRLGGAKNASFKLMIAASLGMSESKLKNLSTIGDVMVTKRILESLGIQVKSCGQKQLSIISNGIKTARIPQFSGEKTRGATLFAALLLAKFGKVIIPFPGGCVLGARPINRHLDGFKSLGAKVIKKAKEIDIKAKELRGASFRFPKKSHTGTEAMIIAAVTAKGRTIIENAAQEPEIDDLIAFLNKMGSKIKRTEKSKIIIEGVQNLKGADYTIMPDRNEAVSFAVVALATRGDIMVEKARKEHLKAFLDKLTKTGARFETSSEGIRFWHEKPLTASKVRTSPHPGFMTDWQPLWVILMTQAHGISQVIETVHNNRLQFTKELNKMGAKITLFNPKIKNPESFYEFDNPLKDTNYHGARIYGPTKLRGVNLAVPDLRAGATLTIAALSAQGKSKVGGIEHIDRGYEDLDGKLRELGAKIKRI